MATRRVHLHIRGFVQGVSFRYWTRQQAQSLGLKGWVRNCPDGSVELVAEGDEDAVDQMIRSAHRGPSMAQVDDVEAREELPEGLTGFRIVG